MDVTVAILGVIAALVPLVITILRIIALTSENEGTKKKLEATEKIVVAAGEAINRVTPIIGADSARAVKGELAAGALRKGVIGDLEDLVAKHHLNDKHTAELAAQP